MEDEEEREEREMHVDVMATSGEGRDGTWEEERDGKGHDVEVVELLGGIWDEYVAGWRGSGIGAGWAADAKRQRRVAGGGLKRRRCLVGRPATGDPRFYLGSGWILSWKVSVDVSSVRRKSR